MIQRTESRLAIAAVFLVVQNIIFVLELLVFARRVRRESWYRPLRQLIGPATIALLAIIVIPIAFANASENVDAAAQQCNISVDGDIAGQGAQIAVFAQVGTLLIISGLGTFHTSATGAKEVGAGLALTHVSLSIALLIQMRRGTLSPADAVVGAMILDAQNVGMSIQLAAKEALASRWQVGVVVLSQAFGLAVIPLLISKFLRADFLDENLENCRCLTVFWWAWLSSCGQGITTAWEMPVFWTYYASRCIGFCQTTFHSFYNTSKFDKADKSERSEDSYLDGDGADEEQKLSKSLVHEMGQLRGTGIDDQPSLPQNSGNNNDTDRHKYKIRDIRLRHVTHLYRRNNGQAVCFREYPATVTWMYMMYGALSLTSMGTAQITVTKFKLKSPSPIDSVGQVISLVVAVATFGRALWLFLMLFRSDRRKILGGKSRFVLPFKLMVARNALISHIEGDYVLCVLHKHQPSFLALGGILTEPFDATSQFGPEYSAPEEVRSDNDPITRVPWHSLSSAPGFESHQRQELHARSIDRSWFDPKAPSMGPYITGRLKSLHSPSAATMPQVVYMVTGIKVAHGVTIYNQVSHTM